MIKKLLTLTIIIFVGLTCFTGCDEFEDKLDSNKDYTYLVTYSDGEINRVIAGFDSTYNELKASVDSATAETAGDIKNKISTLETNLDRLDEELTQSVNEGKITQDVKRGYDTTIEDLRTRINTLNSDLESKGL